MIRTVTLAVALLSLSVAAQAQITISLMPSMVTCAGTCNGSIQTLVNGGDGNYTFMWSNGATSQNLFGLCSGVYNLTVMDGQGASQTQAVTIAATSPVQMFEAIVPPTCGACDGTISVNVTGGSAPYAFSWVPNGNTTQVVTDLCAGAYILTVVDANGCATTETYNVTDGPQVTITSSNSSPCAGPSDLTATVANGTGPFTYLWSTGETTETITVSNTAVAQVTVSDGACSGSASIYMPTIGAQPETYVVSWLNRGFCSSLSAQLVNNSCSIYNGPFSITLDSDINLQGVSPTPDLISGNTATWNSVYLPAGNTFTATVVACVPLTVNCGDMVDIDLTSSAGTDAHPVAVLCSFDPNDKQVAPVGMGPEGFVPSGTELMYTVRFQNTGTIAATFIHVKDQLDADLDPLSFRVLSHSHLMQVSISPTNEVDFFFDNINLPDSTSDEPGSHGYVIYAISPLSGTPQGTEIENTAYIYFDFNEPVITNTTLNTISDLVGVNAATTSPTLALFPNPATDALTLRMASLPDGPALVTITDMMGRTAMQRTISTTGGQLQLSTAHLRPGTYALRFTLPDGTTQVARFAKGE
jgi:uncharacterized repeat protein (TIGR01451 family)